ncbi:MULTISPECIES: DUF6438 domain-containing protein [unclassified Aureispira]|uniref:DUF6438 domain-containing protein n=1 Tax=unclassified Aureispira TaxID=2649989 RepID=UPI000698CE08|nr:MULTISPECIES: DUF6438 domain-containing protein [unclassified Aureispira]WMX17454.1 hypothetical protein QP953_13815 [Aureispira sp. CCB-E]
MTTFLVIVGTFLPFLIIFGIVIRKSARIQEKLQRLEEERNELQDLNSLLKIEKAELLKKQAQLDQELSLAIQNNSQQQEALELYATRQTEFHIIKFGRIPAWGSPSYSISVDALGNVLFHGKEAVRLIGFFQWKIYRKRIHNLNNIIKKSGFFDIKEPSFKSSIDNISGVVIEIYLKNGFHKKITYDHAANYPIDLGFLERKLDIILGTQKLWLYWDQNVVQFSIKRGLNYKVSFILNQGLLYTILGEEYFSDAYQDGWESLNKLVVEYEHLFSEATNYSYQRHPRDTIWVELETGFRFLILPDKHKELYHRFAKIVEDYGNELQSKTEK